MSAKSKEEIFQGIISSKDNTESVKLELDQFLGYLKSKGIRDSTIEIYLWIIRKYLRENTELTEESIRIHIKDNNKKTVVLSKLKVLAEFRYKNKQMTREELDQIQDMKVKNTEKKRTKKIDGVEIDLSYKFSVPQEEWENCYDQLEYNPQRIGLFLGFNFGLRKGEIVNLQWTNINFKANIIKVRETEEDEFNVDGFKPKTKNSIREIVMTPEQKQALLDFKEKSKDLHLKHKYVLYNIGTKNHLKPVSPDTFDHWCRKVKVNVIEEGYQVPRELRPHVLRYSFATALFKKLGYNGLYIISKALGHNDIKTTQQYLAISDQELQQNMLDAFLQAGL